MSSTQATTDDSSSNDAENEEVPSEDVRRFRHLTEFQQRMLIEIAHKGGRTYGLGVKRELEAYYVEEVNHGRLYPNLDTLVEKGFIEKSEKDKRSNYYALTDTAVDVLESEHQRDGEKLDGLRE